MKNRKTLYFLLSLLLLCGLSAACGKKESSTGYYEILSERQDFYDVAADMKNVRSNFLGMQFYQGEAVQLWALADPNDREKSNIYLYKADGERERIMKGLTGDFLSSCDGFLDREGNLYCFLRSIGEFVVIKTGSDSSRIYRHVEDRDMVLGDICQLEDGRIFLTYSNTGSGGIAAYVSAELDAETGSITDSVTLRYSADLSMGTGSGGLICLDSSDIYRIDVDSGAQESIWTFLGTSYILPSNSPSMNLQLRDFRIDEDGCVELLFSGYNGEGSFVEILRKAEIGKDREIITVRATSYGTWFKEMTGLFNQQNSNYYVILETCGVYGDWEDYARLASLEVAAGNGPDLFLGDVLGDYAWEIAQKGGFVDLAPYLKASGIEESHFFPGTFGCWRDGSAIYSVSPLLSFHSCYMDGNVLGGNLNPDIETLVNSLLAWQGKAVYIQGMDSQGVLETLLKGSDDIWDAVDWEAGTCDFSGSLFARILEAAERYGDNSVRNDPGLAEPDSYNLYMYKDSTIREAEGLAVVETLFNDGYHAEIYKTRSNTLSMNANSAHKDGTWKFISFLLEDEAQTAGIDWITYPAKKSVFDSWMKIEQTEGYGATTGMSYPEYFERNGEHYLTDDRIAELKAALEGARFLPIRTEPILDIIYEEAQGYFAGQRSIDEVTANIENRAQLYLNENR